MYHIRVSNPGGTTERILEVLGASSGTVNVTVSPGSARFPDGDVVECDLTPEVAHDVIHELKELGPRPRSSGPTAR
jgi:hypothetical protein